MNKINLCAAVAVALLGFGGHAHATTFATWVSGTGDDANPCSRTAPCATFARALTQTNATGTIGCIDSGDYGTLTINKAVSIRCDNVEARIGAPSTVPGITITAGTTDAIYISGLNIQGYGTGTTGIKITRVGILGIANTVIGQFPTSTGAGINLSPSAASVPMTIKNVGVSASTYGVYINSAAAGASSVTAMRIENCDLSGNATAGVRVLATARGTGVDISDSRIAQNGTGVYINGAFGFVRLRNTIISTNGTGINASAGAGVTTAGTNEILDNGTPGTTPTSQGQQ